MNSDHFSKQEFKDVVSIIYFMTGYKMGHLAKSVHYHKDEIKTSLCPRKP